MGLMMQALLSGANFVVGVILIRRTNDAQYGYYILATNALLLITALQTSFIQPYIVTNITRMDLAARRDLIGGLVRTNRRWVPPLCALGLLITALLWAVHVLNAPTAILVGITVVTAAFTLGREFLRTTLFALHRPAAVLRADIVYVVLLIVGAYVATLLPHSARVATASMAVAALLARFMLSRGLWNLEPWNRESTKPVLKAMSALGGWAIAGSGIHWLLIQGYSYLVAGVLDVHFVAAIAATRLLLVPVFVLSGGVSMLLFPITSRWVHESGVSSAARKLSLLVAALAVLALSYMGIMWLMRDWIFAVVLKKHFEQRDQLLLLWGAVFLVTLCRDQLATLPASCQKFRDMTLLTGFSTVAWAVSSIAAMDLIGPLGAVLGILIGEVINILGIVVMILRETRVPRPAKPAPTF